MVEKNICIKAIKYQETLPLRAAILRPGQPLEKLFFEGDDQPPALHAGAFQGDELVGIASVYQRGPKANSWQLRGMAVAENLRQQGVGRQLIDFVIAYIKEHAGQILWCNARTSAVSFYRSLGFVIISDEFEVPEVGPHFVMEKIL